MLKVLKKAVNAFREKIMNSTVTLSTENKDIIYLIIIIKDISLYSKQIIFLK